MNHADEAAAHIDAAMQNLTNLEGVVRSNMAIAHAILALKPTPSKPQDVIPMGVSATEIDFAAIGRNLSRMGRL